MINVVVLLYLMDLYIEIREIILKIIFLKKKGYKKIFLESEGIVIGRYFPEGLISQAFSGVLGKRNRGGKRKIGNQEKNPEKQV